MRRPALRGPLYALLSAALFATTLPGGKAFFSGLPPLFVAGAVYLSSAAALLAADLLFRAAGRIPRGELLRPGDLKVLLVSAAAGGFLAPVCLFAGISRVPAHVASLLMNLEIVFTVGIAILVFHERLSGRGWAGAAVVLAGAFSLSLSSDPGAAPGGGPAGSGSLLLGAGMVILAGLGWAVDNNASQLLSGRDPILTAVAKSALGGGAAILAFALLGGEWPAPTPREWAALALLGVFAFGLSLVFFLLSLRHQGTARTSAIFSLAPLFGALLSFAFLGEGADRWDLLALVLMPAGAVLVALDSHDHHHLHEEIEHTHPHEHDEHHRHEHAPGEEGGRPHDHAHRHPAAGHSHPHAHDLHHRHGHPRGEA